MTIYLNLYIFLYLINLFFLLFIVNKTFNNTITSVSLPYMIHYITKFSKLRFLYYSLVLNLVGIPPFIFFFIKFNFLINIFSKLNFILFYIVFLVLFLNVLFYIQTFYLKNINVDFNYIKLKKSKINQNQLYSIFFFTLISYFSVFIYSDLFLVFTLNF